MVSFPFYMALDGLCNRLAWIYNLFRLEFNSCRSVCPEFASGVPYTYNHSTQYPVACRRLRASGASFKCIRSTSMGVCIFGTRNISIWLHVNESRHKSAWRSIFTTLQFGEYGILD